jgi:preprotein translocase subunit SecG
MTGIIIGLLTAVLVLDCLLLVLLVLIQLPKKEAGMGQAFGGGATDALFGAGSGNALTKLTKYSAGIFFILAILISMLNGYQSRQNPNTENLKKLLEKSPAAVTPPAPVKPPETPAAVPVLTNLTLPKLTNAAAPADTNKPATPK